MEPLLVSTVVVAISEIGDKTQLLAILLATRFKQPWPIIAGIFCATIANHLLAALAGYYLSALLSGTWFKVVIAVGFLAMAGWALIPDKADDLQSKAKREADHADEFSKPRLAAELNGQCAALKG